MIIICVNRITEVQSKYNSMITCQVSHSFTVDLLKNDCASILSVFNEKLLISCGKKLRQLFIYSLQGRYLSTVTISDLDFLYDATWTPRGNIVYTTLESKKVVVMTESGKFRTYNQMLDPQCLSVSNDNVIYLADYKTGVHQSTDDGVSWSRVFKPSEGWHCWQVIKVTTENGDDFWSLEVNNYSNYHLRVYSVDRKHPDCYLTWRDINVITENGVEIYLGNSRLSYDGNANIFLSENANNAVHMFRINGQYQRQLFMSQQIKKPWSMVMDKEKRLYVGQEENIVEIFFITLSNVL